VKEADFNAIYETWFDKVRRRCYQILRNEAHAEEAAQDTFLQVWRSWDRFEQRSTFSSWIYVVATNCSLMALRHIHRKEASPENYTHSTIATLEARDLLRRLGELPLEIELLAEGYTLPVIAKISKETLPAVKSRVFRSRLCLNQRLQFLSRVQRRPLRPPTQSTKEPVCLSSLRITPFPNPKALRLPGKRRLN